MIYTSMILAVALCLSLVSGSYVMRNPVLATAQGDWRSQHKFPVPRPTPAANNKELRRRESAQVTLRSVLEAPDNVCGYLNASSAQPWGCTANSRCVFATATPTVSNSIYFHSVNGTNSTQISTSFSTASPTAGSVLCCDAQTGCPALPAPTACVDRGMYDYNKTCTGNCPSDPMTLKCTSGIYLYCNTVSFATPYASALFCNYLSTYSALPAETTYAGQSDRTLTPTVLHFATTTSPPAPTTATNNTANASTTASAAGTTSGKPVNKKALIGGVVGGILGLAMIAGLVILVLRWRFTRGEADETAVSKPVSALKEKGKNVADGMKSVSFKANTPETASTASTELATPQKVATKL